MHIQTVSRINCFCLSVLGVGSRQILLSWLSVGVCALLSQPVLAALTPEQVVILANKSSQQSQSIAAYYAKARSIPSGNICILDMPSDETISAEEWAKLRQQVRSWISQNNLKNKIRCFVTVWDVPLKIAQEAKIPRTAQLRDVFLKRERRARVRRVNKLTAELTGLAPEASLDSESNQPLDADAEFEQVKGRFEATFKAVQQALAASTDDTVKQTGMRRLQQIAVQGAGLNVLAQSLRNTLAGNPTNKERMQGELSIVSGRILGLNEGRNAMENIPPSIRRDGMLLQLRDLQGGIFDTIAWIDQQAQLINKNETNASLDSELSLVLWPTFDSLRWQPNYLNHRYDSSQLRSFYRTTMVARIEAPTVQLTRKIIDDSLKAEQEGLEGKIYLDGRGVGSLEGRSPASGTAADFDRTLLQAGEFLKKHSRLEVVINTDTRLFQEGECPDAAVYCGWYSLAKYVDAFDWKMGAIGYHLASNEASTLRRPESEVWCKKMLEDGAAATLGPSAEPYLTAFPRPNEFLPLLLSGRYTLAECFYRSKPYNSWMMVLVGDPLYNPFKNNPGLNMETLPDGAKRFLEGSSAN